MTVPFSQVKPASLKMKVLPRYPGSYLAGPGIAITQAAGAVTTSVDFSGLVRDDILDPTTLYVGAWDNAAKLFKLVKGANLKGAKGDPGPTGGYLSDVVLSATDLNTVLTTGEYYVAATCTNQPSGTTSGRGYLQVFATPSNPNYVAQVFITDNDDPTQMWARSRRAGAWDSWQRATAFTQAGTGAVTRTLQDRARDFVSVKDFGAVGDGVTNDTTAFQTAASLGRVIHVPAGRYLINGQVQCVYGTQFVGESSQATIRQEAIVAADVTLGDGSIILVPNSSLSPFQYYSGNRFEGLTFFYPNQLSSAAAPTIYPATFTRISANPSEVSVANEWRNCQFVNSYIWIDATPGHLDYHFQDLTGCAISRGIMIDGCGGTDTLKNIRMSWFYWCAFTAPVVTWIMANGQGFAIGRLDHMFADDIYIGDMNVGMRFFKGIVNSATGPYGRILNIGIEGCNYPFYVECTHPQGVTIAGGSISGRLIDIEIPTGAADPVHLMIGPVFSWGPRSQFIRAARTCRIKLFGATVETVGVIFGAGTTSSDLFMTGVDFNGGTLTTQAQLNTLVLSGNRFATAASIFGTGASIKRYSGNVNLADA